LRKARLHRPLTA
jgi:hypothetical protein